MKNTLGKILIIGVATLLLTEIGFSQSIDNFIDKTIKVDSLNVPLDSNQPYFPKDLFPEVEIDWIRTDSIITIEKKVKEGTYDEYVVDWYSKHLHAMKEPLLFNRKVKKEVYRFTWLRTFHKPMTFRIEKWKDRYILYWKITNGAGGYEPGNLESEKFKIITEKEWLEFSKLVDKANFWTMELGRSSIGNDGSEWILEGLNKSNYRVVTVWSPTKGNFYEACKYLIDLSDIKLTGREKY